MYIKWGVKWPILMLSTTLFAMEPRQKIKTEKQKWKIIMLEKCYWPHTARSCCEYCDVPTRVGSYLNIFSIVFGSKTKSWPSKAPNFKTKLIWLRRGYDFICYQVPRVSFHVGQLAHHILVWIRTNTPKCRGELASYTPIFSNPGPPTNLLL